MKKRLFSTIILSLAIASTNCIYAEELIDNSILNLEQGEMNEVQDNLNVTSIEEKPMIVLALRKSKQILMTALLLRKSKRIFKILKIIKYKKIIKCQLTQNKTI